MPNYEKNQIDLHHFYQRLSENIARSLLLWLDELRKKKDLIKNKKLRKRRTLYLTRSE